MCERNRSEQAVYDGKGEAAALLILRCHAPALPEKGECAVTISAGIISPPNSILLGSLGTPKANGDGCAGSSHCQGRLGCQNAMGRPASITNIARPHDSLLTQRHRGRFMHGERVREAGVLRLFMTCWTHDQGTEMDRDQVTAERHCFASGHVTPEKKSRLRMHCIALCQQNEPPFFAFLLPQVLPFRHVGLYLVRQAPRVCSVYHGLVRVLGFISELLVRGYPVSLLFPQGLVADSVSMSRTGEERAYDL